MSCGSGAAVWRLLEAAHVDVTGGADPEDWVYYASLYGPSSTERVRLTAAAVAHVRYGWYVHRPWIGISPGDFAAAGSGVVGGLDTMLANEASDRETPARRFSPRWGERHL